MAKIIIMKGTFKKSRALAALIMTLAISACTTPFVNPPKPAYLTKQAMAGGGSGAAGGALASLAMGSSAALTSGIGAFVGGAMGTYRMSTYKQLETLKRYGVQVVQIGDHVRIFIPSDKVFEFDSATIIPQSYPILSSVSTFVERYGNVPITVTGYTDDVRTAAGNFKLSKQQAQSVAAFLWSHGVSFNHLHPVGRGELNPIASNNNPIGSAYNRRIVVSLPVVPNMWGKYHPS